MIRFSRIAVLATTFSLVAQAQAPDPSHLSLQQAIRIALASNVQVDIAQQARIQTAAGALSNQGLFDWNLAASLQVSRADTGSSAPVSVGAPPVPYLVTSYSRGGAGGPLLDLNKNFIWGGQVDLNYAPTYSSYRATYVDASGHAIPGTAVSSGSTPYTGAFTATYTQNLLQGFGRTITTAPLVIAQKYAKGADYTFQQSIISLVANTEAAYWNLVYAQRFLESKQTAQALAQKLLDENSFRLKIGTMARLDVIAAQAGMAQAKQDIITAESQLGNAKDTLIRALYPNSDRPAGALVATDAPDLPHLQLSEDDAVKMALARRVELKSAQVGKDVADLQLRVAGDKVRPQLSAFAQYDGTSNTYAAMGPVNGDLTAARYPGYTVGVKFAMPLQNHAAKGNLSSARAALRNSELSIKDQQLSIILQVRTAVRNVLAAENGVKAAAETRDFQQQTLEAEQTKFKNGISTNFIVLQDLTNLDNARIAEVQAQISYANAVTAMEQAVGNLLEARHLEVK